MLPTLPGFQAIRDTQRRLLARVDAYTLWAFNTQPPLAREPHQSPERADGEGSDR